MFVGANYTTDPSFGVQRLSSADAELTDLSEVSGAAASEAWAHGPLQSMFDIAQYNNLFGRDEGATLSKDEVKKRSETEHYAKFITVPEEGITEREYRLLYNDTRARKIRESAFSRAPQTFTQGAKNFGVMLAVGMVDPLNVGIGYLPVTLARAGYAGAAVQGMAKSYAASLTTLGAAGRAGARATVGGSEGLIAAGITEIPVAAAANLRGERYGAGDVFTSLIFGSVVGSGIHVGGGALYDVAAVPQMRRRREAMAIKKSFNKEMLADIRNEQKFIEQRSQDQVAALLQVARGKADMHSVNQRQLAVWSKPDRAALMQSNIATFLDGRNISAKALTDLIESKRLGEQYRPEDVEAVRAEVIREHLDLEMDIRSVSKITPAVYKEFELNRNVLLAEITEAKALLTPPVIKTKGLRGNQLKKAQGLLDAQQRTKKQAHARIKKAEAELKANRQREKAAGKKYEGVSERIAQIKQGELPRDIFDSVNTEVARRMDIIDATHLTGKPGDLPAVNNLTGAIRKSLDALRVHEESPAARRSFRPEAEAEMTRTGKRLTTDQEATGLAQQAVDAETNARAAADELGVKYEASADTQATIKQVNDLKDVAPAMAACMGRGA